MINVSTMPLSEPARVDLRRYFEAEWRAPSVEPQRADVILALLRTGHREDAERLLGKPVEVLPPAIPPWPPDPVPAKFRGPVVTRVARPNPCAPRSDAHRRFAQVRVGMSVDRLVARGISRRDVRVWTQRGWMELKNG